MSKYLSPLPCISIANRDLNTSMTKLNIGKSIQTNQLINSSQASNFIYAAAHQVSSLYSKFTASAVNKKSIAKNSKSKVLSNKMTTKKF